MNLPSGTGLSSRLADHVEAAVAVPDAATDAAQVRLLATLSARPRPACRTTRPWLALAASLAVAVVVILVAPLVSTGSQAFAAVQQHFRDFRTLAMVITQRYDGEVLQTSRTVMNAAGVLRTDIGSQLSIVVDPANGRMLTLLHDEKQAMVGVIPRSGPAQGDALRWLDELRMFQGKATPILEPRRIDGEMAYGWRLAIAGSELELWADADGLPLSMRQPGTAGLAIDYRFTFNSPIAEGELSSTPPSGYRVVDAATE